MRKSIIFLSIILISVVAFNNEVYSHSGRTNGDGCHNDYVMVAIIAIIEINQMEEVHQVIGITMMEYQSTACPKIF